MYEHRNEVVELISDNQSENYFANRQRILTAEEQRIIRYTVLGTPENVSSLISHLSTVDEQYGINPAVYTSLLRTAYFRKGLVYAVSDCDRKIVRVYECNRSCDRSACPEPHGLRILCQRINSGFEPKVRLHNAILLSSAGSFNYGHWLVDDLARMYILFWHKANTNDCFSKDTVLMPSYNSQIDRVRVQSLKWMRRMLIREITREKRSSLGGLAKRRPINILPLEVKMINFNKTAFIANAKIITPASYHPVLLRSEGLTGLRKLASSYLSLKRDRLQQYPSKLFVARKGSRQLSNHDEIVKLLRSLGYVTIYPEEMGFRNQVLTFANAETIVGIMGAAMTNIVFCSEKAKILFLSPANWLEPFYRTLSGALSIDTAVLLGQINRDRQPSGIHPHQSDFMISPVELKESLALLGDSKYK